MVEMKKTATSEVVLLRDGTRLGERLVASGRFTQASMDALAIEAKRSGSLLGEYLVAKRLISRADMYESLSVSLRRIPIRTVPELPEWDLLLNDAGGALGSQERPTSWESLALGLSTDIARGDRRFFILTTEDALKGHQHAGLYARATKDGYAVRGLLIAQDRSVLDVVLSEWSKRRGSVHSRSAAQSGEMHIEWDRIVYEAYKLGASDIHLKIRMGKGEIRFRIHGDLQVHPLSLTDEKAMLLASSMYNTMVDAGSTGDGFNPRIPQDAVITRSFPEGDVRLRYAGIPIEPNGLKVTLRLIPIGVEVKPKTHAELGYSPDQCELLERIFSRSSGLILFLGTTGSGKSTSMAHSLMRVVAERPNKLLHTVEEPVEIIIPGASQTAVVRQKDGEGSDKKTNEFVVVMRSLMRSDPDYLMVGEIRDPDTAALAIQAVRSGHLCVSTLHTESAPITYDRMAGLGIPRGDMASIGLVAGLIYQRLVPVLCPHCKIQAMEIAKAPGEHQPLLLRLSRYLTHDNFDGIFFKNTIGCKQCNGRGVTGRTVCAEIMVPTPRMMHAIAVGDSHVLWAEWRASIDPNDPHCMRGRTAFEHALSKMRQGITSPAHVEQEFKFLDETVFE